MQIKAPLQVTREIPWDDESFSVTFSQATGKQDDMLVSYEREVIKQRRVKTAEGMEYVETLAWEPERLPGERVRLTLEACDLEDKGKPLFVKGMDRKRFQSAWERLPVEIQNAIHKVCLEATPDWDPFAVEKEEKESEKESDEQSDETSEA